LRQVLIVTNGVAYAKVGQRPQLPIDRRLGPFPRQGDGTYCLLAALVQLLQGVDVPTDYGVWKCQPAEQRRELRVDVTDKGIWLAAAVAPRTVVVGVASPVPPPVPRGRDHPSASTATEQARVGPFVAAGAWSSLPSQDPLKVLELFRREHWLVAAFVYPAVEMEEPAVERVTEQPVEVRPRQGTPFFC